jgi:hypothetical protein
MRDLAQPHDGEKGRTLAHQTFAGPVRPTILAANFRVVLSYP